MQHPQAKGSQRFPFRLPRPQPCIVSEYQLAAGGYQQKRQPQEKAQPSPAKSKVCRRCRRQPQESQQQEAKQELTATANQVDSDLGYLVLVTEDGRLLVTDGIADDFRPDETAGYAYETVS